jgi:tRNA U34 2-thiouridine synthase MnmA/TrmU
MKNIEVRIRHLGELIPATIEKKSNKIIVTLKKLIQGIAEGQSAVIYTKQGIMLGGGEIAY